MKRFLTNRWANLVAIIISAFLCVFLFSVSWISEDNNLPLKGGIIIGFCSGLFGGLVLAYIGFLITNIFTKSKDNK
jgi:membrane protease YdiL (CAAX protease family)